MRRDVEGNGLKYIDLFAFHGINSARKLDWVLKEGGCMEVRTLLRCPLVLPLLCAMSSMRVSEQCVRVKR